MNKKKVFSGAIVVAFCCVLGIGFGLSGCSSGEMGTEGSTAATGDAAVEKKTMNQWGKEFPLQYNSYAQIKVNPYDGDKEGHYCLRTKELGPIGRDEKGYKPFRTEDENYTVSWLTYNDETHEWVVDESVFGVVDEATAYTKGCFSCRSSQYQEIEEREGDVIYKEPLDDAFIEEINGQMWDCGICHGDTPLNAPDSQLTYWNEAAGDAYDDFEAKDRVCGQCHTTMNHFSVDHYRYGLEVDGLYDSKFEQDQISFDEDTGITTASGIYLPDVEIVRTSKMRELGVTCVDCHMPKATDKETGETYTMHNASGSPLENENALEYCLTCHESRGIESTDDMVKMVRGLQSEAGDVLTELKAKCDDTKDLIQVAYEGNTVDAAKLDEAREKYSRAYARYQVALGDPNTAGLKVVHNPDKTWIYAEEASKMLDEARELLK